MGSLITASKYDELLNVSATLRYLRASKMKIGLLRLFPVVPVVRVGTVESVGHCDQRDQAYWALVGD